MVPRMTLRYISVELYHWIVNEVEKVSPKFASRIQSNSGRHIFIALSTCKVADGVLTSSLEPTRYKLFFGIQALPKTGGHVLTLENGISTKSDLRWYQDEVKYMISCHYWMDLFNPIEIDIEMIQNGVWMKKL